MLRLSFGLRQISSRANVRLVSTMHALQRPPTRCFYSTQSSQETLFSNGNASVSELARDTRPAYREKPLHQLTSHPVFFEGIKKMLPFLCDRGGWSYAEAWFPQKDALVSSDIWFAEKELCEQFSFLRHGITGFSLTYDIASRYKVGIAWKERLPIFTNEITPMDLGLYGKEGEKVKISSAFFLPVVHDDQVLSVLVFFSSRKLVERPELTEKFFSLAPQLLTAHVYGSVDLSITTTEQMRQVHDLIVQEGIFSPITVFDEVDWWFNSLKPQQYYFQRFDAATIAKHVHSYIAAKKLAQTKGDKEDIWLRLEQPDRSAFFLCPAKSEAIQQVERHVESLITSVPAQEAYSLTFFRSKGPAVPQGTNHLALFILDCDPYPHTVSDELSLKEETDIFKVASNAFLQTKSPLVRSRYQQLLSQASQKLSPIMQVYETYHDGTVPIMLFFRKGRATTSYLTPLTQLFNYHDIIIERKFIETFSNGMIAYSFYVRPPPGGAQTISHLLNSASLMYLIPLGTPLFSSFVEGGLTGEECAYATAASQCVYYFLSKTSEEFQSLSAAFKDDPALTSRLKMLETKLRREAISMGRIHQCVTQHLQLIKELFKDFATINENISQDENIARRAELEKKISKEVTKELDLLILETILNFNANLLKTNFFKQKKSSLSFRINPKFLAQLKLSDVPYGLFYIMGADFHGFHLRFTDVARGGIRVILSSSPQVHKNNLETLFNENYDLAHTQHKKNKDIPEGGSKGTILVNTREGQRNSKLVFQKYVSGILDLLIPDKSVVDHYGKPELLFLGPDEGTAEFMDWAALYARTRGYPFWKAFTTGKADSLGGVPHDKYGMTTRSVHRFVLKCLEKRGLNETQVTKIQTGGPDGDLGSNEILLSQDKTLAIVDGSGVVYDPNGLDREELTRLAKLRKTISFFDTSRLNRERGAFRVLVTDRDVTLPSGELVSNGLQFRNEFHLHDLATADLFVPCGGRPAAVNVSNVHRMFFETPSGEGSEVVQRKKPKFKFIVEGANLFFTNDARRTLENSGVVLFRDASANKGGVTSSSMEVLAALAMDDEEFAEHMMVDEKTNQEPAFYMRYVKEIQKRIEDNANLEFDCIWQEHERTKIPRFLLTETISDKINEVNYTIQESNLMDNKVLRDNVLRSAIPECLVDLIGLETVTTRVPHNYLKAIFSSYLASRYVYQYGLESNEFSFYNFINQFTTEQEVKEN